MQFKASKPEAESQRVVAQRDDILSMTYAELSDWVDTNIQDMSDVRDYLKRLSRIVRANKEGP